MRCAYLSSIARRFQARLQLQLLLCCRALRLPLAAGVLLPLQEAVDDAQLVEHVHCSRSGNNPAKYEKRGKHGAGCKPAAVRKPATMRQLAAASAVGCVPAALNAETRVVHTSAARAEPREILPEKYSRRQCERVVRDDWMATCIMGTYRIEKRVLRRLSVVEWTRRWNPRKNCRRLQPER